MTVSLLGGESREHVHYLKIHKRIPNSNSYPEFFVLYQDGNSRIKPFPPTGFTDTPFGSSVILGSAIDKKRPFSPIKQVIIDPNDLSMDILYAEGGDCHLEFWIDRENAILDVSDIRYDTTSYPFACFRSMWVTDGNADIDRVQTAEGVFPILGNWRALNGSWWRFYKEVPSYHNTWSPDIKVEVLA